MKTTRKILSMLLCLALVLGFVPTLTMPAQAAEGTWTLVTDVNDLAAGDQVIIAAKNANYAISTTQESKYRGQVAITKNADNTLGTLSNTVQIFTLKTGNKAGTFAFYTGSGYLSAVSSSSNDLKTNATLSDNSSFKIEIASATGIATVRAQGTYTRNLILHNPSSTRFSCYANISSSTKEICLYKFVAKACEHEECTYDTTATQHTPKCECGWVGEPANHDFGKYTPVEGGHNRVCGVCEYAEATAPCADNNGDGNCDDCGTSVGCPHEWENAYNDTQHYQVCALCDDTKGEEDHELAKTYTDTTHTSACDCGYSVTEKHVLENGACSGCGFALKAEATGGYVKITSAEQLVTGKYVLVNTKGYAPVVLDDDWVTAVELTVSGDVCTDPKGAVWTLTVDGSSVILTDSKGVSIAPPGGDKNGIKSGAYKWAWEFADGKFTFSGTGSDTVKLASNVGSSNQFRAYKNSTTNSNSGSYPTTFTLYKYVENDTEVNVFQADTRLKDTLNLAFHFTVNGTDEVVKAGALITIGDETYNYIATEGKGYYSVEVSGIYAQSIDTKVYIKPYAELATGLVYGEQKSTSVLGCLEYMYGNPDESDATKLVIKDLLNYANAARNYFVAKGTMEAPAQAFNNVLAEGDRVLVWNDEYRAGVAEVEETTGAFEPVDGKIIAGIQEALRLRVEFEDSNVAGFVYWNEKAYADNSGNHTVDTGTKTFVMDGGVAKGYIENIYAYEMYENFFIRAYNAEGELSETYTRSIAAYITIEMDNSANDEAYVELCKAMLIYGNTAMKSDAIVKGQ